MEPSEKKLALEKLLQHYRLSTRLSICPGGFETRQTGSASKLMPPLGMAALLMVLLYFRTSSRIGEAAPWFKWFVLVMIFFAILAVAFTLYRKTIFDLEKDRVRVEVWGIVTFQRPFSDFEKFTFDPGYVVNGIDPGGVLYMHFKAGGKLRLVQMRDPVLLENLQSFVLEALAM